MKLQLDIALPAIGAKPGWAKLRRLSVAVVALGLVASGCNSRVLRPPAIVSLDSGEASVSIPVGDRVHRFSSVFISFSPSTLTLHPGDGVKFEVRYTGEPHTVAMGTLIDSAVGVIDRLGPEATLDQIEGLPEMRRVPTLLPNAPGPDPEVNRSAAERCFLDSERPPVSVSGGAPACPRRDQPDFDGTQSFYSSGFIPEGEGFRVKVSGDTKPGTYRFMCLVHRATMHGSIEVTSPNVPRPNVRQVKIAGRDEQRVVAAALREPAETAANAENVPIAAGTGPSGLVRSFVSSFIPSVAKARVGEPVRWRLFRTHSISFNPSRRASDGILVQERDGTVKINKEAWQPAGVDVPVAATRYPPPRQRVEIDAGTWSGDGARSTGVLRAIPPLSVTYTLRFAKPGTYDYVCLVHNSMRGRIEVSD